MPSLADFSPSSTITAAQTNNATARNELVQGDAESTDAAALQDYRRATGQAQIAAMSAQSMVVTLAATDASLAGYQAAIASLVQSTTASVQDAGQTTDKATARAAATAGIQAADAAIQYGQQALDAYQANQTSPWATVGLVALGIGIVASTVYWLRRTRASRATPASHVGGHGRSRTSR